MAALEEECFRQGDLEKHNGLPVSPLFDRCKPGISKSQVRALLQQLLLLSGAGNAVAFGLHDRTSGGRLRYQHMMSCHPLRIP